MATQEFSFDIVSEVDLNEAKNAFNQATKELEHRYDFRGSNAKIEFDGKAMKLTAEDEFRLGQVRDILFSKLVKREIDPKMVEFGKIEPGAGVSVHQTVTFKQGISQEHAKALAKQIKDNGLKVHAQVQGEQLRVSGKSKDDLQKAIQFVKGLELPFTVTCTNFR
ncbi:MAG: YajQ family cyclic di-GMP-binding protein [Fimbriimonadaceae bacterium]